MTFAHCPPQPYTFNTTSLSTFSLQNYTASPWYVLWQQDTRYLPPSRAFCVTADYTLSSDGKTVSVFNQAWDTSTHRWANSTLKGHVVSTDKPYRLTIGPVWLSWFYFIFYGDYWIIDFDPGYQWAVVSGGAPTVEKPLSPGKVRCRTGVGINQSGLWIFSKQPQHDTLRDRLLGSLESKGWDISEGRSVSHDDCPAPDAPSMRFRDRLFYWFMSFF